MKISRMGVVVCIPVLVVAFFVVQTVDAEKPDKKKGPGVEGVVTDGVSSKAVAGTAWLIYDDNTREEWADDYTATYDAAGNRFDSTWGTGSFFCDSVSAFAKWTSSYPYFYLSAWNTQAGPSTLAGNSYTTVNPGPSSGSSWVAVNSGGWVNNSTYTFSQTAWIGNDFFTSNGVGLDTDGGSQGFMLTAYTGNGYTELPMNAMIRARFNGDNVPVELMSFSVE
jgi:hypothetical protein